MTQKPKTLRGPGPSDLDDLELSSAEAAEAQRKGFAAHVAAHPEIQHAIKALRATNPKPLTDERTTLRDAAPPAAKETPDSASQDESGPAESDPEVTEAPAQPAPENKRSRKVLIALLGLLCALPLLWLLLRDKPQPEPQPSSSAKPTASASGQSSIAATSGPVPTATESSSTAGPKTTATATAEPIQAPTVATAISKPTAEPTVALSTTGAVGTGEPSATAPQASAKPSAKPSNTVYILKGPR